MRSSAPVATSQTVHGGSSASRRGASPASRPSPDALSSAPGDGGTVSAWAISTRRQRPPSRTPITLRERPRGVENRCTRTSSPALSKRRRIRVCARRSSRPAAGRGPSREIDTATLCAGTPSAAATSAVASNSEGAAPR